MVGGSDRTAVLVLDTPGTHAEMFGIDDDGYIACLKHLLEFFGDLNGKPFLYLRTSREMIYDTVEFR